MLVNRIQRPTPTRGRAPSHSPPDTRYIPAHRTVNFLGWFSIGLGVAEIVAPKFISKITGVKNTTVLPLFGVREVASGAGILLSRSPAKWLWARVAGDVCDLATLTKSYVDAENDEKAKVCTATLAVLGVTAMDIACVSLSTAMAKLEG